MKFSRLVTSGVVIACFLLTSCSDAEVDQLVNGGYYNAYDNMTQTASQYNLINFNCTGRDTDADGYISCTAQDRLTSELRSFQCSTWAGQGCKLSMFPNRNY